MLYYIITSNLDCRISLDFSISETSELVLSSLAL